MDEWVLITCESCKTMNSVEEKFIVDDKYKGSSKCHNLVCKKSLEGAKTSKWKIDLKYSHNYGKFKQEPE